VRLKIFSCHHLTPKLSCNTEIFQSLVSNLPEPEDGSFISDLGGVNIAADNRYAEMRHQFYVWQNLLGSYDYIGFEHYSRSFFVDALPVERLADFPDLLRMRLYLTAVNSVGLQLEAHTFEQHLAMRRSLDAGAMAQIKKWIGEYDIVVPRPNIENSLEMQWKRFFDDDTLWSTMVEGVSRSKLFERRVNYIFYQMHVCYFANMYIMRTDLLDEYLTFCFDVLAFCQRRLSLNQPLGYFSERLFSCWLYQKRIESPTLRVLELPLLMLKTSPNQIPGAAGPVR
jgi:hypothetical protein